ncbi:hypothetical protein C0992_002999 [Termitomyces sp. T32_za158]|nr:hypothetical protein C0992_002999 [Termitomyces sp. T32_za158]
MISVVLDAGAQKHFEGIRVLIVQGSNTNEMSVTKRTDLARLSRVTGLSYRKALIASRAPAKSMDHCAHTIGDEKLCTIIFELAPSQTYWGHFARLILTGHHAFQPSLRIIHSHIERGVSTFLFLQCSHSAMPDFSPGGVMTKPTRVRAHCVRVIPVTENRPLRSTFKLPRSLLSRIICIAFSDQTKGWRKGLLSCSLVCKSWVYLADIFFTDFEGVRKKRFDHDPPYIASVARSLQENPFRARLIMTYSPAKYLRPTRVNNAVFRAFCEAQNMILHYATAVKDLTLEFTHAFLFQEFYDILRGLRGVSNLQVIGAQRFGPPDTGDVRHLTFEEILKIVSLWPCLSKLVIENFKLTSGSSSSRGADLEDVQITCPIHDLYLGVGILRGPLLMRLTGSLPSPPTICFAQFDAVKGLTNSDFLAFLLRVSPTLVYLSVSDCPMWRNSDDEEYAIDAAMPNLTSLETLSLGGDLSSEKALIRKIRRMSLDEETTQNRHKISLFNPKMVRLDVVMDALSVTGWDAIHICMDTPAGYSPQLTAEVTQAAKARGIDFSVAILPR